MTKTDGIVLDTEIAALIKGMLARGDKQSDIAACFLINGGRVAEINTGLRFYDVRPASPDKLPPPGPYLSPYELFRASRGLWRIRLALEEVEEAATRALAVIVKAEQRVA